MMIFGNYTPSLLDMAMREGVKTEADMDLFILYRFIQRRVQGLPLEERGPAFRLLAERLAEEINEEEGRDARLLAAVTVLKKRLAGVPGRSPTPPPYTVGVPNIVA